jgi:hypothetical protein
MGYSEKMWPEKIKMVEPAPFRKIWSLFQDILIRKAICVSHLKDVAEETCRQR